MHAVAATGIASEGPKAEFLQHAKEEQGHMMQLAERINQLGGAPDFDPKPPPMASTMTRTRLSGRPKDAASSARTPAVNCVDM